MFMFLSDGPGMSVTRICADDFGSALRGLHALKTQASIFKIASRVAGLELKPSKCVLIISCIDLTDFVISAIKNWLKVNVPDFASFVIADAGKYLGWILGRNSIHKSFNEPARKYVDAVHEICIGQAPATVALCRYNQRAVPIFSYVAQFADPPKEVDVEGLSQWAVHSVLRMPPQSMSRQLMYSIGFCSLIEPLPLKAYCSAILFRFASGIRIYLSQLRQEVVKLLGDSAYVINYLNHGVPTGGLDSQPMLCTLLNALNFQGPLNVVRSVCSRIPEHKWILEFPDSDLPAPYKGIQAAMIDICSVACKCPAIDTELAKKAVITLGERHALSIRMAPCWFSDLLRVMNHAPIFLRMCWLKAIAGAWCTTTRMHAPHPLPCIFGCLDSRDELRHYLICPLLWQFAREFLNVCEPAISIASRLCLVQPSVEKLRALAFVHSLYHALSKEQHLCVSEGVLNDTMNLQRTASGLARSVLHFVNG